VGEIVAGIDGGEHLIAVRAEEDEAPVTELGGRTIAAEGGDGDGSSVEIMDAPSVIGEVDVFLPVRLHQHTVDDVDVDGAFGGADGFNRQPTPRLRAWRRTPSTDRTVSSMADGVKVLWPSPAWSSSRRMKSRMASELISLPKMSRARASY